MSIFKKFSESEIKEFQKEFLENLPLRYVCVDNFLDSDTVKTLSDSFPNEDWNKWRTLGDAYQKNKFTCDELLLMPPELRNFIQELNSPYFLNLLEQITGIEKLISDPYLSGGGLHLSTEGGILAPHTDFHTYDRLDLYRRINVLIYLNPLWQSGDGGSLRVWDAKDQKGTEVSIDPIGGRLFLFATNDRSIHGFTDPIRPGVRRKSIALYYYTASEDREFSGDSTTHWYMQDRVRVRQYPRELVYRFLHQTSRGFSLLAHLVNPRQGRQWWKTRQENQVRKDLQAIPKVGEPDQ